MERWLPFPERPGLSLLILWLLSMFVLWAAREPMLKLVATLASSLADGMRGAAQRFAESAERLRERARAVLLATGERELSGKLEQEFARIDESFSERLGQYSRLHRRLDDVLTELESEYRSCGDAPLEVPGWATAVESIAALPSGGDPHVHKVLEGIRTSLETAERKALSMHRTETAKRHKILGRMRGTWHEIRTQMTRIREAVGGALETASRINGWVESWEQMRNEPDAAARALTYSSFKMFATSLLVLGIALGGAFINFQLIALPMSELVPAGARLGGVPVPTVAALVIVLMEAAVGIFMLDMLGITELFPRLGSIPASRRRLILGVAFAGLFVLASVEASLAILRETIVAADAALKLSLAGSLAPEITAATSSRIPVAGQAVLGFALPWILALVAVPLEMLLDSGRHVLASLAVMTLHALAALSRLIEQCVRGIAGAFPSLYDVYISLPLRLEQALRSARDPQIAVAGSGRPKHVSHHDTPTVGLGQ